MSLTASLKRAYLHRWHRLNVSDRCPVCGHVESFSHALCQCSFILTVWTWVLSIVNQFYFVPLVFSPSLVLFKHGLPSGNQHVKSNAIASFLFNVTLNEIWSARNLHTFEGKPFCAQAVISKSSLVSGTAYARHTISTSLKVLSKSGAIKMFCALLSISPFGFLSRFPSQGEDCLAAAWLPGQSSPWDV